MNDHESQMFQVKKTKDRLEKIKPAFGVIDGHYQEILDFRSAISAVLATDEEIDKQAFRLMDDDILSGPAIITSMKAAKDLKDACDSYTAALAVHGLSFQDISGMYPSRLKCSACDGDWENERLLCKLATRFVLAVVRI